MQHKQGSERRHRGAAETRRCFQELLDTAPRQMFSGLYSGLQARQCSILMHAAKHIDSGQSSLTSCPVQAVEAWNPICTIEALLAHAASPDCRP